MTLTPYSLPNGASSSGSGSGSGSILAMSLQLLLVLNPSYVDGQSSSTLPPSTSYNGNANTPQMGWDTYNAYALEYNETTIRTNAERLINLGFRDLGYKVVIFDDAMTERERAANGSLVENGEKFPPGLKPLADELHDLGLQFGVYSSAGKFQPSNHPTLPQIFWPCACCRYTCGKYPGSLGYEQQDAEWWASLGADYLKYDNCYNEGNSGTPKLSQDRYAAMSNALNSTSRNFTYSLCNWGDDKPWEWASTIANSARISGDIYDSFLTPSTSCPCGPTEYYCQLPGYGCSILNILGKASYIVSKNQPGYWNDLDMLEVGNGGASTAEYRTHMTMWAAIKSPLIMGNKLDELTPEDYAILTNPAVLALSQDPLGSAVQRRVVMEVDPKDEYGVGEVQVWSGSLYGGDYVVIFLNAANSTQNVEVPLWQVFGLPTAEQAQEAWSTYDLWGENVTIPADVAAMVLNGTMDLSGGGGEGGNGGNGTMNGTSGAVQGYYNATELSWADGLLANDTRLLGQFEGMVSAGGTVQAQVDAHDVKVWRFRSAGSGGSRRRDEL